MNTPANLFLRLGPRRIVLALAASIILGLACVAVLFYLAGFKNLSDIDLKGVLWRQCKSGAHIPMYLIHFALFLAPGAALLSHFTRRSRINHTFLLMSIITLSSAVGYVVFWIYFLDHRLGWAVSVALELSSITILIRNWRITPGSEFRTALTSREVLIPLSLMFFAGLFYIGMLWWFDRVIAGGDAAQVRFLHLLPPDNVLPRLFAERLYAGEDPRPLLGEWLSSDRPPLQAGLTLMQYPFKLLGINHNYQIMATIYQCIWIPAIWTLCRTMGISMRRSFLTLLVCMLSGFFLLNSVYTWPKLFSASLVLWAFTLLIKPLLIGNRPDSKTTVFAALAAALGFLAHGGVAFSLIALGLFFVLPRYFIGLKNALLGCVVFVLTMVPWTLYQKLYEPPANRLFKWYLAGVIDIDARTTGQTLKDAYGALTWRQILENRVVNVTTMFPDATALTSIFDWRVAEFFRVSAALGILNIGWLIFAFSFFSRSNDIDTRAPRIFLNVALLGLLMWILIVFGNGLTIIHQGSYATMMLLYMGLTNFLLLLPRRVFAAILVLHAIQFLVVWIVTSPAGFTIALAARSANILMLLMSAVGCAGIFYVSRFTNDEPATPVATKPIV